jgi:NAD(P)-dependent dehydrogenase (short-subunit alcohol dehydrogenase family)
MHSALGTENEMPLMAGSLAQALGPHGISVSAVAPGFVETAMAKRVLEGPNGDAIRSQSSWGRVGYFLPELCPFGKPDYPIIGTPQFESSSRFGNIL